MIKKIIIAGVIIVVLAVVAFFVIPWGEYESKLEKSDVQEEVVTDSTGTVIPSLSLIQGTYSVTSGENSQAEILFDVEGLKKTKGAFEEFNVSFEIPEDYEQSKLTVEIQSASINTGNSMRDEHLAEEDFFHVTEFPIIKYEASTVAMTDTGYIANGNLLLLEASNPLEVPFKHLGNGTDKNGNEFEAFEGTLVFDRTEYGMEEVSGAGNVVTVSFYCELILAEEE